MRAALCCPSYLWKEKIFMSQMNKKAVKSIEKLIEAGFNNEKSILDMTMDDILAQI